MNWIFEIYGNTYKAITLQRNDRGASQSEDHAKPSLPILHPIGFLLGPGEGLRRGGDRRDLHL
jgi:hypothetical protein